MVRAGKLPPVEQRVSDEPLIIAPKDSIGSYGGTLRGGATGPGGGGADLFLSRAQPLVILEPDMKTIVPNIIKGWDLSDDMKTFTVYLRKGMKFSDGTPLTAEHYLFWYEDIMMNEDLTPVKPWYWAPGGEMMDVQRLDDYTVRFVFSVPYPVILDILAVAVEQVWPYPFAPKQYLSQFHIKYNDKAGDLAKERGHETWSQSFLGAWQRVQTNRPPEYPVVNPWMPSRVDSYGNEYFERNPYYWKVDTAGNQLPYIDTQARMLVENREVWNLKVVAGEFDFACQHTSIDTYTVFKEGEAQGGYHAMVWPFDRGSELVTFKFNQNYKDDPVLLEIFRDNRFREAVSHAFNRERVNKVVYFEKAIARTATVVPSVSYYEDWMGSYHADHDPDKANRLLDEIGLQWDSGGKNRLRPDGKPLAIVIEFTEYAGARTKMLELAADDLQNVGIQVTLKTIERSLYSQRSNAGLLQTPMWNLDATTEIGFHRSPVSFLPYANDWRLWLESGGERGDEPPQIVKDYWEKAIAFQQTVLGTDEYKNQAKELVKIALEQHWNIALVGQIPKPAIIQNNLLNTPGEEGIWSWDYRFWVPFQAEQWYFSD